MKKKVIYSWIILFLAACGKSNKTEDIQRDKAEKIENTPPVSSQQEEPFEDDPEESDNDDTKVSLDSWIAKLPATDPRRIRFEPEINQLWKERDIQVEAEFEEASGDLATMQSQLSAATGPEEKANLQSQIGSKHLAQRNYKDAVESYSQALTLYEELKNDEQITEACMGIGTAYTKWNNFSKAEEFFSRAADLREQLLGADHPKTIKARKLAMTNKSIQEKVQRVLAERKEKEAQPD